MKQKIAPVKADKPADIEKIGEHTPVPWHPAFIEALKLELDSYMDSLEFLPEYQLTTEPLRIDCIVIKKIKNVVIKKNIAAIFRETNIIEYKSPDDYLSVFDFYKVYGYACLYASLEKVPITNLTVSFVESRHPRELLVHLRKTRGYKVEETRIGVYTVKGDILPIQIIDSKKLSAEENLWLKGLSKNLNPSDYLRVNAEIYRRGNTARVHAYLYAITQANVSAIEEAILMSNDKLTLDQVFERTGLAAIWEARGEARAEARAKENAVLDIAQNMVNQGYPIDAIVSLTKLEPEKVKTLFAQ